MIRELFCTVLDISVISGIFILIIAILRVTLRRSPKWVRYFLWILVAVRLLCPVFLESGFSILPDKIFSVTGNIIKTSTMQLKQVQSVEGHQSVLDILSIIWLSGIVILFLRLVVENIIISRRILLAVPVDKFEKSYELQEWIQSPNVYFLDGIRTSFTRGIFNPKIYIPSNARKDDIDSIIIHEKVHISRKDLLWKQLGYIITSIHWFNPIVWLGYILFINDIELACDEKVILSMDEIGRKKYLLALIHSTENSNRLTFSTVAFGKMPIRRRLKEIMNVKKLSIGAAVVTVLAGITVGIFFITKPVKGEEKIITETTEKTNEKGEIVLPKGSNMNQQNAIIVPEEEWEELGLLDSSMYENVPGEMRNIIKVYKWNIETDEGIKTYYSIVQ